MGWFKELFTRSPREDEVRFFRSVITKQLFAYTDAEYESLLSSERENLEEIVN